MNDIVASCELTEEFSADENKFAAKYGLAEMEARSNNINAAFDIFKV